MTDSKEWVSIKIPESVRDPARDDPRTYGQIMEAGLANEPFAESDTPMFDADKLAADIADRVDSEGGAGPETIAREVSKKLDYVELSNRVAEELEGRMG